MADFSLVIRLDPENANAHFNRGCCYDSLKKVDAAIADYSRALELDAKNEDAETENGQEEGKDIRIQLKKKVAA